MTTPQQARDLADRMRMATDEQLKDALRSLSDQVEALTAERDSYKAELQGIANANLRDWYPPPTTLELLQYTAKWVAHNERAKVTVVVWKGPTDYCSSTYDYTPANKGVQPNDPEVMV